MKERTESVERKEEEEATSSKERPLTLSVVAERVAELNSQNGNSAGVSLPPSCRSSLPKLSIHAN